MNKYQQPMQALFKGKTMVSRILIANTVLFVILQLEGLFHFLYNQAIPPGLGLISYLGVPADGNALVSKPWTLLTYMFSHQDFLHLLMNMAAFYIGGTLFQSHLGGKKLLLLYIGGGLAGAVLYIFAFQIFPVFEPMLKTSLAMGASASVLAILVAIAWNLPQYQLPVLLVGKIKLKYLVLIFVVMDILSIDKTNSGGHIAHLGGAAFGYLYYLYGQKGKLLLKLKPRTRIKEPKFRKKTGRPLSDDEYNKIKSEKQKKVDLILEKISKHGYEALNREEKDFLFQYKK